jgi:outer membrane protein TolC
MLRATEDVENAITTFVQSNMQKDELMSAVKAHELAYAAAQEEYNAGTVDFIEVLVEEGQLLAVREAVARMQADEASAAVSIFRALGGGWTPETM